MAVELRHVVASLVLLPVSLSAQPILQRLVQVDAQQVRVSEALALIASDGDFKLSYNAISLNGDSVIDVSHNGTVQAGLVSLVGDRFDLKETGEHIILLRKAAEKKKFNITGSVVNQGEHGPLPMTYVHALSGKDVVATNEKGAFSLSVNSYYDPAAVVFMRKSHHDTVVYVNDKQSTVKPIRLRQRTSIPTMEPLCVYERCNVSDLGVAQLLVSKHQLDIQDEFSLEETREWQVALIPSVSSNGDVSSFVVNKYSFNVLAGYARGLNGFELGGVANLESHDVKGIQIAGVTNLVGGRTKGVQVAGAINHTMRSMQGMQVAGAVNVVWDSLSGTQLSGAVNVVKGKMSGSQITGGLNVAVQNASGVQVAGLGNVTVGSAYSGQVSDGFNYARNIHGFQVAPSFNFALDSLKGTQICSGFNFARMVKGVQVAPLNVARNVKGWQIGLVNVNDTISGVPLGLFSFSRKGYHRVDMTATPELVGTVSLRTGVRNFHNIFKISPRVGSDGRWAVGYGFGAEPKISKRSSINIELTAEQIVEKQEWVEAVNLLVRLNMGYTFSVGRRVAFFAGPSANIMVSDWRDEEGNHLSEVAPAEDIEDADFEESVRIENWLSLYVGAGFRF